MAVGACARVVIHTDNATNRRNIYGRGVRKTPCQCVAKRRKTHANLLFDPPAAAVLLGEQQVTTPGHYHSRRLGIGIARQHVMPRPAQTRLLRAPASTPKARDRKRRLCHTTATNIQQDIHITAKLIHGLMVYRLSCQKKVTRTLIYGSRRPILLAGAKLPLRH